MRTSREIRNLARLRAHYGAAPLMVLQDLDELPSVASRRLYLRERMDVLAARHRPFRFA
jgi:hypothetical protein